MIVAEEWMCAGCKEPVELAPSTDEEIHCSCGFLMFKTGRVVDWSALDYLGSFPGWRVKPVKGGYLVHVGIDPFVSWDRYPIWTKHDVERVAKRLFQQEQRRAARKEENVGG